MYKDEYYAIILNSKKKSFIFNIWYIHKWLSSGLTPLKQNFLNEQSNIVITQVYWTDKIFWPKRSEWIFVSHIWLCKYLQNNYILSFVITLIILLFCIPIIEYMSKQEWFWLIQYLNITTWWITTKLRNKHTWAHIPLCHPLLWTGYLFSL